MAYTPINWQTGDTITAEKLNKMDRGWDVETTELFSETVTTTDTGDDYSTGQLAYVFQQEPPAEVVVTFDGTDYMCERDSQYGYGGTYDFSTYPFYISPQTSQTDIYTEAAGTHTVAATATTVQTATGFDAAVKAVSPIDTSLLPFRCVPDVTTYEEMRTAADAGRLLYFYPYSSNSDLHLVISFGNEASATAVNAYPEGKVNVETYGFTSNMVFYVAVY